MKWPTVASPRANRLYIVWRDVGLIHNPAERFIWRADLEVEAW